MTTARPADAVRVRRTTIPVATPPRQPFIKADVTVGADAVAADLTGKRVRLMSRALGKRGHAMEKKIAALVADAFQDSEFFLPKIALEDMGVRVEVVSTSSTPIEIYSYFTRIGHLDVNKTIDAAEPDDYIGVLVPGGARSPAILSEHESVLAFLREVDPRKGLVASICRGSLLVAKSGIARGRRLTGFHLAAEYPDLIIRPVVEEYGGIWSEDTPVVVDENLVSSRHPNDMPHFVGGIDSWLHQTANTTV
jgi:deglycase